MPHVCSETTLESLPDDVLYIVVQSLPRASLTGLRCVNRRLASIAGPRAFRSLRLRTTGEDPKRFIQIAKSKYLSNLVREVTCDIWLEPHSRVQRNLDYKTPSDFFDALPFISLFRNLESLQLCFTQDSVNYRIYEETADFRYRVLDTIFHSVAGTWSEENQRAMDERIQFGDIRKYRSSQVPQNAPSHPIMLKSFGISNLEDYPQLTSSPAFKTVIASTSLSDIRLHVATGIDDCHWELSTSAAERHQLFQSLPSTWLQPAVAANLRVLSLGSRDWWGWYPRLDWRLIGAGRGMPNLKALALRNFVFSHHWQIDWFASLGLEKLHLDRCVVLLQASHWMQLDNSHVTLQDENGDYFKISNEGYLASGTSRQNHDLTPLVPGLRWSMVFQHWENSMVNLRDFKMGTVMWDVSAKTSQSCPRWGLNTWTPAIGAKQLGHCSGFRCFDSPSTEHDSNVLFSDDIDDSNDHGDNSSYVYWRDDVYQSYESLWKDIKDDQSKMMLEEWYQKHGSWMRYRPENGMKENDQKALRSFTSKVRSRNLQV